MRWFFPDWSGDFRLEANGDSKSVLTIVSPTAAEVERLGRFLKKARAKGWVDQHVGFVPNGEVKILVAAPVAKAGRILLGEKTKGILTAVRSVSGKVTAVTDGDVEHAVAEVAKKDTAAAASVRRPTLCCPHPQPGPDVRASEVLQAFCTPRQQDEWERSGMVHCYGNLSGRLYEIAHRHHPLAVERQKIVWDVEGQHVMHCYDWSVPPAEEVLVMKLTLEHAEHWIRNPSGCFGFGHGEPVYNNPFMSEDQQAADGLPDAASVRGMGAFLAGFSASVGAPKEPN